MKLKKDIIIPKGTKLSNIGNMTTTLYGNSHYEALIELDNDNTASFRICIEDDNILRNFTKNK